jgi:phosphoglycerate-specific signal transduction histidine kinase
MPREGSGRFPFLLLMSPRVTMASVVRFFGTGSFAVSSLLTSIRARLYVAFGFVAALTVLCSLIALYAFTTIGDTTTSIVSRNMPATVESLRLAEETSQLLASAPRLMTAEDEAARAAVAAEIEQQQKSLLNRIENLRALEMSGTVD